MFYAHQGVRVSADKDQKLEGEDLYNAMLAFHHLEGTLGQAFSMFPGQEASGNPLKAYNNITFTLKRFIDSLKKAQAILQFFHGGDPRPKFLDCGCGFGTKSFIARQYGFDGYGVEINPVYAEIAAAVIDGPKPEYKNAVTVASILDFDRYGEFDCIYWYTPIRDHEKMQEFERQIVKHAKAPTVLMPAMDSFHNYPNAVHRCFEGVYLFASDEDYGRWHAHYAAEEAKIREMEWA